MADTCDRKATDNNTEKTRGDAPGMLMASDFAFCFASRPFFPLSAVWLQGPAVLL